MKVPRLRHSASGVTEMWLAAANSAASWVDRVARETLENAGHLSENRGINQGQD